MQTRWGIIYCPKVGSQRLARRWKKICRALDESGIVYDFVRSDRPGAVERLAAMMTRSGFRTIVVVGGDAALSDALRGIMTTESPTGTHPALGVIPNGFGNDFARYWGLDVSDYRDTIRRLMLRRTRRVDVGVVEIHSRGADGEPDPECRYFLNCINVGVGAQITRIRRKTRSFFGSNTLSYLTSSLLLLLHRFNYLVRLHTAGEKTKLRVMTLCIGNARGYGQTPSAVPYNGRLDVTAVSVPKLGGLAKGVWLLLTGRFLGQKGLRVWRTDRLRLDTDLEVSAPVSVDGHAIHDDVRSLEAYILPEEIDFLY
ncbi:MAG: lipid kinase [Prevotellaceae bacterium]|nr:lipid kinase [Prevotellaceae bacterium]